MKSLSRSTAVLKHLISGHRLSPLQLKSSILKQANPILTLRKLGVCVMRCFLAVVGSTEEELKSLGKLA